MIETEKAQKTLEGVRDKNYQAARLARAARLDGRLAAMLSI